ncbi:MAG: helix-turn-helix transcriptional regulator [Chloroflexota bacterium]
MPDATPNGNEAVLRRKILGVKIRHARIRSGLSPETVGEAIGVSADTVSAMEQGQHEASLPQLEVMAFLFNIPVVFFWSDSPLEAQPEEFPTRQAMAIRRRIIGVLLRKARTNAKQPQEELARLINVDPKQLEDYEFGRIEIPLQHLESMANYLNVPMSYFIDQGLRPNGTNGNVASLDEIAELSRLPADVREFLLNPANLLYINIAMHLSDISADTLRGLAAGLLEVTY